MMEHKTIKTIIFGLLLLSQVTYGQRYKAASGYISFFSEEILEDITAVNEDVQSIFDSETGQIVFSVPIKSFTFEKSLMQEHFNEKYMESEKYPGATFRGTVTGYKAGQANTRVWAEGELEIHGVKQKIRVPGELNFSGNKVDIKTKFNVLLKDYNIKIPELMFQKIAEEIEITVDLSYEKM